MWHNAVKYNINKTFTFICTHTCGISVHIRYGNWILLFWCHLSQFNLIRCHILCSYDALNLKVKWYIIKYTYKPRYFSLIYYLQHIYLISKSQPLISNFYSNSFIAQNIDLYFMLFLSLHSIGRSHTEAPPQRNYLSISTPYITMFNCTKLIFESCWLILWWASVISLSVSHNNT